MAGKRKYEHRQRMNEGTGARTEKPRTVIETVGACTNVKKCKNTNTTLGNGLCMTCWDRKVQYRGDY